MNEQTRIDEIRRRVPDWYPAPWLVHWNEGDADSSDGWYIEYPSDNPLAGHVATVPDYGSALAEFMAAAREDIPWLLAEHARLTAERDELATKVRILEAADHVNQLSVTEEASR